MSKLLRKGNQDKKDSHLKGAFKNVPTTTIEDTGKTAMLRVDERTKDIVNAVVKIEKYGTVNNLVKKMLEQHMAEMSPEDREKVELLISI